MKTIREIKQAQRIETQRIRDHTTTKYRKHIYYLNKQYDLLFELLANYYEYRNLKHSNSDQFIVCYSLFSEMLRKQRLSVKLIINGHYDEAAELVRHIMQSSFQIIYLANNEDSWKDWFKQQNYEQDKLIKSGLKNPNTIFSSFRNLLRELDEDECYKTFQKLSSWSHPSIESMRSNLELTKEQINKYFFTPRFNDDKADGLLNLLFGFVNEANWKGFKEVFVVINNSPEILKKYVQMQKKTGIIFDKFYNHESDWRGIEKKS